MLLCQSDILLELIKLLLFFFRMLTMNQEVSNCTPKEKLEFLQVYVTRYWNFVCRQAAKLRKLDELSSTIDMSTTLESGLNDTSLMFTNASSYFNDTTTLSTSNTSAQSGAFRVYTDLFEFYEPSANHELRLSGISRRSTLAHSATGVAAVNSKFWDSVVHSGVLNLIFLLIQTARGDDDEMKAISCLDEALELFNLTETQDKEFSKTELEVKK